METSKSVPTIALEPVEAIAAALIRGSLPLSVALSAWRSRHRLRLTDVSGLIGRPPGAVSYMLAFPKRVPRVRREVEELIGYEDPGDAEVDPAR